MPTCDPLILTPVARHICALRPESVLDIGIGYGKWGLLVREYAEVWHHHRLYKKDWKVKLIGVEIHEQYRNPVWGLYDYVHTMDALDILDNWAPEPFDLCLMIDVLEHIPKDEALRLLRWLKANCKKVIVSYSNHDQKDVGDNKHEDHVSKWGQDDFRFVPASSELLAGDEENWGLFLLS